MAKIDQPKADNSIWRKSGHFYFALTINLIGFIIGITLIVMGLWQLGLGIIVLLSLTEIYALFRSQVIVQNYNNRVMLHTLKNLNN